MARRRSTKDAIGRGLQAAAPSIGIGMNTFAQYLGRQEAQEGILERQTTIDQMNYRQQLQDRVAKGELEPQQAAAMLRAQTGVDASFEDFQPSVQTRLGRVSGEIAGAKNLSELPDEHRVRRRAAAERLPTEPITGATERYDANDPDALKSTSIGPDEPPELASLLQELTGRRSQLQSEVPYTAVDDIDPNGVARRRQVQTNKLGDVGSLQTERTPQQQGQREGEILETRTPFDIDSKNETEVGTRQERVNTAVSTESAVGPVQARNAGLREQATLDVKNSPANIAADVDRATKIALAQAQASGQADGIKLIAASRKAVGDVMPMYDKLVAVTARLNTGQGAMGRLRGAELQGRALLGNAPDVATLDQLTQQMLRPIARAMGVNEANVSEGETGQALKGLGVGLWNTAAERANGLRNLRDLITVGPVVAGRLGVNAGVGERISLGHQLIQQRQQVEQQAIAAGATSFLDPVTMTITPVVK